MAQTANNLPAMQEMWILSLSGEDTLQKGMVTHSNILAWKVPWTEEIGRLQYMGLQRTGHNCVINARMYKFTEFKNCYKWSLHVDYFEDKIHFHCYLFFRPMLIFLFYKPEVTSVL